MLVFPKEGLVLLAVPKTGTTALSAVLAPRAGMVLRDPPALKHMPLRAYQRQVAPLFARRGAAPLETVALIREPRDWLASWYRYRRRPEIADSPNSTAAISFAAFVSAVLAPDPPAFARVGRQSLFVAPANGGAPVDHLFRYENMAALLTLLARRLGPVGPLPRRNFSAPADTTLPASLEARLRAELADEFTLWEGLAPGAPGLSPGSGP